jgi:hypothetical protein
MLRKNDSLAGEARGLCGRMPQERLFRFSRHSRLPILGVLEEAGIFNRYRFDTSYTKPIPGGYPLRTSVDLAERGIL